MATSNMRLKPIINQSRCTELGMSNTTKKSVSIAQNQEQVFTIPIWPRERECWVRDLDTYERMRIDKDIQLYKLHLMDIHPESRKYLPLHRAGNWREDMLRRRKRKVQEANEKLFGDMAEYAPVDKPISISSGCLPCNPSLWKKTGDGNARAESDQEPLQEEDWVVIPKAVEHNTLPAMAMEEDWIFV